MFGLYVSVALPVDSIDTENIWDIDQTGIKCKSFGYGADRWGVVGFNRDRKQETTPSWLFKFVIQEIEYRKYLGDAYGNYCYAFAERKFNSKLLIGWYHRCTVNDRLRSGRGRIRNARMWGPVSGDVGGPLMCSPWKDEQPRTLTGIYTFSTYNYGLYNANLYAIHAPLYKYIEWLRFILKKGDGTGYMDHQPEAPLLYKYFRGKYPKKQFPYFAFGLWLLVIIFY